MDTILQKLGLERLIPTFEAESISPDIVCKLSLYEMNCLGVTNRSHVMNLRTECVSYGSFQPLKRKSESAGPSEFVITKSELDNLLSIGFQIKEIAQLLSVSESTIYRRMRMFGLSKRDFTSIDDTELSHFVRDIVEEFPNCGEVMLNQILTQKGIKIQRYRLRDILHEVDESGVKNRKKRRLHRRVYSVAGPNHLWHVDTNHKLIRWRFIIVAGIDGFSRMITFLQCLNNNRAETLLEHFKQGIENYGLPLRVRTDKGMENIKIADFMLEHRGNTGILTGKSVHNQRIERLWRDLYEGVLSSYHSLFYYMEDEGILDAMNDAHLWALHYVYMHKINEKLNIWREAWASHRLRTVRTSPIRLFTSGMMNNPVGYSQADDSPNDDQEAPYNVLANDNDTRPILDPTDIEPAAETNRLLALNCPKSWTSDNFGIDIYLKAVELLES